MELDLTGLVLPERIETVERSEDGRTAEFTMAPLERGFGHTLGNTVRRILLSSLRGAAVWGFRMDGVVHEHQTVEGVVEDIHQVIQNLKTLVLTLDEEHDDAVLEFKVEQGEVLGIAGVQGNGQTELVEAIMGLQPVLAGSVRLQGTSLAGRSTKQILRMHVGYVPEDRSVDGLVREFTVAENLVLNMYDTQPFGTRFVLRRDEVARSAAQRVSRFDVRTSSPFAPVSTLSGGNQQKVIVARELTRPLRLFVAAQPTRGLDVGSIEFIHGQILHEREVGTAVLLVSSELDEVLALADRVAVMYRGRILAIVPPDTPREEIGLLMAGVTPERVEPA